LLGTLNFELKAITSNLKHQTSKLMNSFTRREFLASLGLASVASLAFSSPVIRKTRPLLSFSTLGCPDWTFKTIVDFAATHQYQGIELRGLMREMDLPKCPEFNSTESIRATLSMMKDKKLKFVNLGSSVNLHQSDGAGRTKQLDDGRRFIDLAQKLACPFIRVFPNNLPKDQEKDFTLNQITKGLLELGNYAKGSGVKVLMETHGDVVYINDLEKIMKDASHPQVGLIWDALNMWTITKESPTLVYGRLKKYIDHVHIKNALVDDGKISYVLLEQGQVPIFEAIDVLEKGGYKGYYSFEWEKLWQPEIALADYPKAMVRHLSK
jgi:sugar phosphate isomerase/epimerase